MLDYTGQTFFRFDGVEGPPPDLYTTDDRVTIWLELAVPLAPNLDQEEIVPLSFVFMDGVNTIDETSENVFTGIVFSTDDSGTPTEWEVFAQSFGDEFFWSISSGSNSFLEPFFQDIAIDEFSNGVGWFQEATASPGEWKYKVPLPSTLCLLGIGLLALRRKR
jgi:hypothetical protein